MPKKVHGYSHKNNKTYHCWKNMRRRCIGNAIYSLRGIAICKRWDKFENFLADMGEKPEGFSIDRIDNNKGYCKSNCRWADRQTQARNTRLSYMVIFNKQRRPLLDLCEEFKINQRTVKARLLRGWTLKEALTGRLRVNQYDKRE